MFCFTWYPNDIILCLWSGFIYPRIRAFYRKTFSRSLFQKEAFEIRFMDSDSWNEAEVILKCRGKLCRRDYLDYLKNEARFRNENWSGYRRKGSYMIECVRRNASRVLDVSVNSEPCCALGVPCKNFLVVHPAQLFVPKRRGMNNCTDCTTRKFLRGTPNALWWNKNYPRKPLENRAHRRNGGSNEEINSHCTHAIRRLFYGLVVPLCGTSWDKVDWDRFHRGHRACPATRTGLQRVYMTCPQVSFDLSQSQWDRFGTGSVLVPLGQAQPVPMCLSHWDRLCLS